MGGFFGSGNKKTPELCDLAADFLPLGCFANTGFSTEKGKKRTKGKKEKKGKKASGRGRG